MKRKLWSDSFKTNNSLPDSLSKLTLELLSLAKNMWYAEKEKRYWSSLLKEGSLQYVESDQGIPEFFDPVMFKRFVE